MASLKAVKIAPQVEAKRKRKKLMYIGGAVAVVGIASYFIFKKK